jgi:hypothetical protein
MRSKSGTEKAKEWPIISSVRRCRRDMMRLKLRSRTYIGSFDETETWFMVSGQQLASLIEVAMRRNNNR